MCWPPPDTTGGRRFRMLFWSNELGPRGAEVAMFDYASAFEDQLCGEAFIGAYVDGARGRFYPDAMAGRGKFEARFPGRVHVLPTSEALDATLASLGADMLYTIQAGCGEVYVSPKFRPMLIHGVFHAGVQKHCAAISPFKGLDAGVPIIPHMVAQEQSGLDSIDPLPLPPGTERVFCRHGGFDTMDIEHVRVAVRAHAAAHPRDVFLLLNTRASPGDEKHANIVFLPMTVDLNFKRRFLKTCSACLHARAGGETFGLAVAECSNAGLPVITSTVATGSSDTFHLQVLGRYALNYTTGDDVLAILRDFDVSKHRPLADEYRAIYRQYAPEPVMRQFVDGFGILDDILRVENPNRVQWQEKCTPPPTMRRWLPTA